jgi:methylthioxylose transferase
VPTAASISPRDGRARFVALAVVVGWVVLVLVARHWARELQAAGNVIRLKAAPLVGTETPRWTWRVAAPVLVGGGLAVAMPVWAARLPWRRLLVVATLAALAFAVALAVTDGWHGLTRGLEWRTDEYIWDVDKVGSPGGFLRDYVADIEQYVTHVRAHPPLTVLLLWGMDRVGLGGFGWNAVLFIGVAVSAVAAVLVAVRDVAGEDRARAAAPFLAVAPAAIWVVVTGDAFFLGVGAWAVTCVVLATGRRDRTGNALALGGGLLFGLLCFLSYGLPLLGILPLAVAVTRRNLRPIGLAMLGALPVFLVFWGFGFFWFDGLQATHDEYWKSVARDRMPGPFVLFNTAAFWIALGPAVVAGVALLRDRRLWMLVGGALACVAVAMASQMSKGEVERIWLPFAYWVIPAGASYARLGPRTVRIALLAQAAAAIGWQCGVKPRW